MQDSPTRTLAKPSNARARVLLLGANVWAIGVLWPLLGTRPTNAAELALSLGSPLLLLLGSTNLAERLELRPFLWLIAFPATFAATMAARAESVNQELYGPFGLVLLWLSLCGYAALAIVAVAPRAAALATTQRALGNDAWDAPALAPRTNERALVAACFAGAAALCLIAPHVGDPAELERAFGPAAASAGVFSAVVGGALAICVVVVYLGSGLRAAVAPTPRVERSFRAAGYLLLALLSAITYFVVQP